MFTQKKILLVDDSPTVLLMERLLLQGEPYVLLSASNGMEAVKAAAAQQPDLILMDVVMPGMDGFEVCRLLRAEEATRATPIILVTTKASLEHVERGYESGCNDYVTKPFNGNELRAKIENFLGR
ncbi:response regulator [Stigmatella erecta]|uniref:Response regulator receiver domain-containing protein n=1 Tax=Stigmatella erecta TaxID=83460 RepID=A0A1H9YVJ5_9BACT|nr:response regulator [Stigmatella erecta]SES73156.1 Response regulator receiver domain-containing protein [Stigmatella erecta]